MAQNYEVIPEKSSELEEVPFLLQDELTYFVILNGISKVIRESLVKINPINANNYK